MRKYSLLLVFYLIITSIYAQNSFIISGNITNLSHEPIGKANVVVLKIGEAAIRAFSITNNEGNYSIKVPELEADSLVIRVTHIAYEKEEKIIPNRTQKIDFQVINTSVELEEIIFENREPIRKYGDTLRYDVESFKRQEDRVIADVLKRMPGIEVKSDGKILYQNQPINKYYIEGLDLLEGKYNLANQNLPADAVAKVEVLENHQPIRILDSLVYSGKAALNIKLKKSIAVTGTAELGMGFLPLLWKANITPMLFNKKQQLIVSYQTNNTGKNIANQLKYLSATEWMEYFEMQTLPFQWLGIVPLNLPPLQEKIWLDNQTHVLNFNHLTRLKKDFQLKSSLSYLHDYQQQYGKMTSRFFMPSGTVELEEIQRNAFRFRELEGKFILEKNTTKNFLRNEFSFERKWNQEEGLITGTQNVHQKVNLSNSHISNRLKWIFPIKNTLLTFKSNTHYTEKMPSLLTNVPYFDTLFSSPTARQMLQFSDFHTKNSLHFGRKIGKWMVVPKIGFSLDKQQLNSWILGETEARLSSDFQNNLSYLRTYLFVDSEWHYQHKNWYIQFRTPFGQRNFEAISSEQPRKMTQFTFEPRISVRKEWMYWKVNLDGHRRNKFGTIQEIYPSYILQNYRNLTLYNAPIRQETHHILRAGMSFQDPISAFFVGINYTYTHQTKNILLQNSILPNGQNIVEAITQKNISDSHITTLHTSKYSSKIKTTWKFKQSFSWTKTPIFMEEFRTSISNRQINSEASIETNPMRWLSWFWRGNLTWFKNQLNESELNEIFSQNHEIGLRLYPSKTQTLGMTFTYLRNHYFERPDEVYFLNLNYRHSLKKGIDLDLNFNNILNTKYFYTIHNQLFTAQISEFQLRPRQIYVGLKFGF